MAESDLWGAAAELAAELHPQRLAAFAGRVESCDSPEQWHQVKASLGPNVDQSLANRLYAAWCESSDVHPRELAAALRAASAAATLMERQGSVEMVWTGPSTGLVPVRQTEGVLCQLIDATRSRLFVVSFVAYQVPSIAAALRRAAARKVCIDVLLETSAEHGGKVTVDSVSTIRATVPSANIYVWRSQAENPEGSARGGAVHAKCAVADGQTAFITSANLSTAAMERNMELGVLVRGGHLPEALHQHLEALVATGKVERV